MLIHNAFFHYSQKAGASIFGPVQKFYKFFHFPTSIIIEIDGQKVVTKPNACIFSRPGAVRNFHFTKDSTMNWIHANPDIAPLLEKYEIPLDTIFYPVYTGFISDMIRKMRMEKLQKQSNYNDVLDAYVVEFLVALSRASRGDMVSELSSVDIDLLYRLRMQVFSNAEQKWTVEQMAQLASLSPSRFHSVYKRVFGCAPMQDVINAKMDLAQTILLTDNKPTLSEVAERLGYKSTQHFIVQFKAATGMTPGAYRRHNR